MRQYKDRKRIGKAQDERRKTQGKAEGEKGRVGEREKEDTRRRTQDARRVSEAPLLACPP